MWIDHSDKNYLSLDLTSTPTHTKHAYTDGSKGENGVGSGIAIFKENKLTATLKYKLNWQCSNNQAEQLAILKALDYIQHMKIKEREVLLSTDSRITLDLLQNRKKHTYLIEKIRTKVTEMERNDWQVKFNWIKVCGSVWVCLYGCVWVVLCVCVGVCVGACVDV